MRTIAIGDLHGNDKWKQVVLKENFDKIVFVGDYFDSFEIPTMKQLENFRDLIAYKKANTDRVVLLLGNHDFHYTRFCKKEYKGFSAARKMAVEQDLNDAIKGDLIQACYFTDTIIFSHAGVTMNWCENNGMVMHNPEGCTEFPNMGKINDFLKFSPRIFEYISGGDPSGDDVYQSPIWVRPNSLRKDKLYGFTQVVGHTYQDNLVLSDDGIVLIDTFNSSGEYLVIENNKFYANKI